MNQNIKIILTIIHFNDSYDIQPLNGKGGIVNFKAKISELRQKYSNSLLLFSGDCFSPSILSNIKQGWQMVNSLNQLNIDVACYGNHQFDYPHEHTVKLAKACNFQWLLGNIKFTKDQTNLGEGRSFKILQKNGLKIGLYGVAGQDWLDIMCEFQENEIKYINYAQYSNQMCEFLRKQQKCDLIIALTHMRNGQDLSYPLLVKDVDLVLGGHDHVVLQQIIDKVPVIKSGSNFRQLTMIKLYHKCQKQINQHQKIFEGRNFNFSYQLITIQSAPQQRIDKKLNEYVNQVMKEYQQFDKIIGYTQVDLQTRFSILRAEQTPYGNFFADLFRLYLNSDIAFCNSGAIRNDCLLHAGPLKYSQISNITNEILMQKALTGKQIIKFLQISVSALPNAFKGSFMQVSGIKFAFNIDKPQGQRIVKVLVGNQQINLQKVYTVTLFQYTGTGNDGYTFVKNCPVLKDPIQTISILNLLELFFNTINFELIKQKDKKEQHYEHKKRSAQLTRIISLQHEIIKDQSNNFLVSIKPELENRIVKITNLSQINLEQLWNIKN